MATDRDRTIHQLDLERRWLTAKLDHGAYAERPADTEAALRRIEDLDLAIAVRPAADMEALLVKLERALNIIMPDLEGRSDDDLEVILMKAILADMRRQARHAIDAPAASGEPAS